MDRFCCISGSFFQLSIWKQYGTPEALDHPEERSVKELARRMGLTIECTTERSLHGWLYDPEHRITLDFVVGISLMWELPDWISKMLIDRAMIRVSEYDRRHQALEYIRTVLWDQGIDAGNKYLVSKGLEPLAF